MQIGVFSDIHENFYNLRQALKILREREITTAICLGDFINPGIVKQIIDSGIKTFAVWGNNDGEKVAITRLTEKAGENFQISDTTFANHTIAGRKVFLSHHPDFAESLARSGDFDAVFYGHDHIHLVKKLSNGCLLANPGEISSHKTGRVTFLIWNTDRNDVETIEVNDCVHVNPAS